MSTNLIGPDGRQYTLDNDANLESVLKVPGWRVETAETPQTALESAADIGKEAVDTATAATAGAVQGVTAGGAGALLGAASALGSEGARQAVDIAKRLQAEHPVASTVGELAGAVASPINKVAGVVEGARAATAVGRLGQKALGGAAVGGLFGAGTTLSDAALGDVELTADKLLAGAGLGALLGAAGGGLGGAVEEAASAVLPKLGTALSRAQLTLDDIANNAAVKATRAQQGVINRLGEQKTIAAAKALRDGGHLDEKLLTTPDDLLKSVEARIGKVGAEKGAILELAEAGGARPKYSEIGQRLNAFEAELNPLQRKVIAKDLSDLREGLEEIGLRQAGSTGSGGSGFRALDDLRQTVAKRAKFSKGAAGVDDEALQLKRQLAGVFRDEVDRQLVPQLGSDIGKHWADTKALYGSLKDAATLAKSGAGRVGGLGLKDLALGAIGGSLHPAGVATALASKFLRDHGPMLVAKAADSIAKSPALTNVAKSLAAQVGGLAPKLGPYGAQLVQAFARGPAVGLATHALMAEVDPGYRSTATLAGLEPEDPATHGASLARAQGLAGLQAAAKATDDAIATGIEALVAGKKGAASPSSVFGRQDFGAKAMRRGANAAHDRRAEDIRQLAASPEALIERVAKNLEAVGPVSPGVAAALTQRAQAAAAYLAKAAELPPKPGPLAPAPAPNEAQRFTFALKLQAVERPMVVLEHAAAGTLTRTQLDAVRAVYPRLAQQLEEKALERLVSSGPMPYRARMMLSLLAGVSADGTTTPQAIAANQAALARAQGKPSEKMGPAKEGEALGGIAERMATPGQRKEMKGAEI